MFSQNLTLFLANQYPRLVFGSSNGKNEKDATALSLEEKPGIIIDDQIELITKVLRHYFPSYLQI